MSKKDKITEMLYRETWQCMPKLEWGNDPDISIRASSVSASHGEIILMLLANCLYQEEISVPS